MFAQQTGNSALHEIAVIGFWNVENLYDTLDDPFKNDDDFTPAGVNHWIGERYRKKIDHLAYAISLMGADATPHGLAMLGVCEVENKSVLKDLVASPHLKARNYQYVLIEGPDVRGVDPGLLYNPLYFKLRHAVAYHVKFETDSNHKTRDILCVSGEFGGEPLAVLVNHWPSRRGGEMASRPNRNAAARIARRIADSISQNEPGKRILIMGDLNDDPVNECVKKYIRTYPDQKNISPGRFFNPMEKLFREGIGTLAWQDSWNLFDQIMLNEPWLRGDGHSWQYEAVRIFNKPFLRTDYGNFKGYPFRTFSGGAYTAGYSDHFSSYIIVTRKKH
jgi:hypothetical protein